MDSFSNTVFIDVTQAPEQYLLTQDVCHTITNANQNEVQQTIVYQTEVAGGNQPLMTVKRQEEASENVASDSKEQPNADTAENSLLTVRNSRIKCPECHRYTAETEEKMLRHIKKVHKGENPFQCYMCDYSTYNKSLFEEHVRIHQGIKPFKCTQCDYKSASKKNLKKHVLIHRPNNPLKCSLCDFIARHSKALKRHQDSHTTEEWYKFDSCKFQFQDMAAYKKHEKTHKLKCKDCEFKTCSRPYLKRHMVKEHGFKDEETVKRESFTCQICGWNSSTMTKILLHLIHHPNQNVDENVIDISILRKNGIMT